MKIKKFKIILSLFLIIGIAAGGVLGYYDARLEAAVNNKLTISYKDDGCGFDFEQIGKVKSNNTGYGIRMLVERVNLLRGSINYNKDEKEFVINIPLK